MTAWIKNNRGAYVELFYSIPPGGGSASNSITVNALYKARCCEFKLNRGDSVSFINRVSETVFISYLDGFDLKFPYSGDIQETFDGGAIVTFKSPLAKAINFSIVFYTYNIFSTSAIQWRQYDSNQYIADIYLSANTNISGLIKYTLLLDNQYIDGSFIRPVTFHAITPHSDRKAIISTQSTKDVFYFDQQNFIKNIEGDNSITFEFIAPDILYNSYLTLSETLTPFIIRLYSFNINESDHVNVQGELLNLPIPIKDVYFGNSFYVSCAGGLYTGVSIRSNFDNITKFAKNILIRRITAISSIATGLQLFYKDPDLDVSHTQIIALNKNDSVIGGGMTFADAIFLFDQSIYGHTSNTFTGLPQDIGYYQLIAGKELMIDLPTPLMVSAQYLTNIIELRLQATVSTARISYLIEFDEISL